MSEPEKLHRFWVPTIISIVALVIGIFNAIDARRARELSVTPLVGFFVQDDENERALGVSVKNSGPGVAVVKAIRYYINHQPIPDWGKVFAAANVQPSTQHQIELEAGDSLAVGEEVWLLRFEFLVADKQAALKFADFLDNRLGIEIEYCAVGAESCNTKCSTKGLCKT